MKRRIEEHVRGRGRSLFWCGRNQKTYEKSQRT